MNIPGERFMDHTYRDKSRQVMTGRKVGWDVPKFRERVGINFVVCTLFDFIILLHVCIRHCCFYLLLFSVERHIFMLLIDNKTPVPVSAPVAYIFKPRARSRLSRLPW